MDVRTLHGVVCGHDTARAFSLYQYRAEDLSGLYLGGACGAVVKRRYLHGLHLVRRHIERPRGHVEA